jgi:PKHD-type hydroxylase
MEPLLNLETYYYHIPTGISPKLANFMKEECLPLEKNLTRGEVFFGEEQKESSRRKCNVGWIPTSHWIGGIMTSLVKQANDEFFHYDLTKWTDKIQYTVYDSKGSHYGWHTDRRGSESGISKDIRKLSISLLLSNPSEYEGGELQLHGLNYLETLKPEFGQAIIFPANCPHRVRPIKSGVRRSLVGWFGGPRWK